ncbi:MAG TPA: hypothetical protein VFB92_29425 [Vicinamibacterales bacterium]|nr:hypothetical protein [Vicinamibacterales bacterium]
MSASSLVGVLFAGTLLATSVSPTRVTGQTASPAGVYSPPRTAFGQPDLQGVWQVVNTAAWDVQDHSGQRFPGLPARFSVPAGQGVVEGNEIPYQPWALARKQENHNSRLTADPEARCYLPGVPRITYMPYPFQIFQFPDRVVILYEYLHATREIYTDGSRHPDIPVEFWLGDSRGRWEGNTLVVDVTLFTGETWFDRAGNFHSTDLHVVERYTRTGRDHMLYEVTIEDPKVFTRPWKIRMPLYRRQEQNVQLLEFECYAYAREGPDADAK